MKNWMIAGVALMLASLGVAFAGYRKAGLDMARRRQGPHGRFMMSQ